MNRRNFLQGIALMFAAEAAERVFPFRVYSIPNKIVAPGPCLTPEILLSAQRQIMENFGKDYRLYGGARGGGGRYIAQMRSFHSGHFYTYDHLMKLAKAPETFDAITV